MTVKITGFDAAQDDFAVEPSKATAGAYLAEAIEYWSDDMIGDDTLGAVLCEIRDWLQQPRRPGDRL